MLRQKQTQLSHPKKLARAYSAGHIHHLSCDDPPLHSLTQSIGLKVLASPGVY